MKVVYMGTPGFAVAPLEAIVKTGHDVELVVTQPDKINSRRGKKINFMPVKKKAIELGIEVFQPEKASDEDSYEYIKSKNPDVLVVCAYGQIVKENILNLAKYGAINIHASLLPEYRGAAPLNRVIMEGKTKSGVTIMQMDKGMDTGDMLAKAETDIPKDENIGWLHDKLSEIGARLIVETLEKLENGNLTPEKQDETKATYAPKIEKDDLKINWCNSSKIVHDKIRGLSPFPLAVTFLDEKNIKIYESKIISDDKYGKENQGCGTILEYNKEDGLVVKTVDGAVGILELKMQGKKKMRAVDFFNGNRDIIGKILK